MKPAKPLNFAAQRLTLKNLKRFQKLSGKKQDSAEEIDEFQRLIASASDWTYEELEEVTADELQEALVGVNPIAKAEADAVPPPSTTSSNSGPVEAATLSQIG